MAQGPAIKVKGRWLPNRTGDVSEPTLMTFKGFMVVPLIIDVDQWFARIGFFYANAFGLRHIADKALGLNTYRKALMAIGESGVSSCIALNTARLGEGFLAKTGGKARGLLTFRDVGHNDTAGTYRLQKQPQHEGANARNDRENNKLHQMPQK